MGSENYSLVKVSQGSNCYHSHFTVPNDANTTSKAGVLLNSLITPSFIIELVTFVTIMDPMTILTEKLQGREENILSAYNL